MTKPSGPQPKNLDSASRESKLDGPFSWACIIYTFCVCGGVVFLRNPQISAFLLVFMFLGLGIVSMMGGVLYVIVSTKRSPITALFITLGIISLGLIALLLEGEILAEFPLLRLFR